MKDPETGPGKTDCNLGPAFLLRLKRQLVVFYEAPNVALVTPMVAGSTVLGIQDTRIKLGCQVRLPLLPPCHFSASQSTAGVPSNLPISRGVDAAAEPPEAPPEAPRAVRKGSWSYKTWNFLM